MKMIPSVLLIFFVLLLVSAGTWAAYTDVETSSGNTFTAGTLDLYMTDNGPIIDYEWTLTNMIPGMSKSGQLNLYNNGTVADHVEITFSTICRDPGADAGNNEESDTLAGANGMDSYLKVDSMSYSVYGSGNPGTLVDNGISSVSSITDSNGNGFIDLADLNGLTLDNLAPPGPNQQDPIDFNMKVTFDMSAPNDYQGDECILTMQFDLNQDPSQ
ncbi:hypothetical protein MSSIH_3070 [Methanosarcina siciliae HI350]|uniref:Uncharacterized protein n=1 Tax=Methanosarcina siciliae HI350 TaxID=1434119 RepID=A0A0E3PH64_9EURY|nr:TasA family protein [Methanosarcina siciliae]AKB33760.1 hypothetical protein MSSIH_3070 [Methanosarcina siciliae HI350]